MQDEGHIDAYDNMISVLKYMNEDDFYENDLILPAACWLDNLVYDLSMKWSQPIHFDDVPYIIDDIIVNPLPTFNISSAINQSINTLYSNYSTNKLDGRMAKSLMLRFFIHLAGDIHQPLHSINRFSKIHPNGINYLGDYGGNLFHISYTKNITNLHALWDSVLGDQPDLMPPIDKGNIVLMVNAATSIMKTYPKSYFEGNLAIDDVNEWINESYLFAKNTTYVGIQENETPSKSYITIGIDVAHQRIALAGYRMAKVFLKAFGKPSMKK